MVINIIIKCNLKKFYYREQKVIFFCWFYFIYLELILKEKNGFFVYLVDVSNISQGVDFGFYIFEILCF